MRQAEQENARLLRVPLDMVKPSPGPAAAVHDESYYYPDIVGSNSGVTYQDARQRTQ